MDPLLEWAQKRRYSVVLGPFSLLDQVRNELASRHEAKEFDEGFFRQRLSEFKYLDPESASRVKAIGIVAVPRPAHLIRFMVEDDPVDVIAPPTYVNYTQTAKDILADLNASLAAPQPHFVPLHAPLKALATRMGLARYGRNNITYVQGMGSYHQLVGFASDLALDPTSPPELTSPSLAPECEHCSACQQACPTGAIGKDRFLLRGERCLPFHNESEEPWPGWLPSSAHNCIVGCLTCQKVCPQDSGLLRYETVAKDFTSEETAVILADSNRTDPLWGGITDKLARIGLEGCESVLSRNLKALLAATSRLQP